MKQILLVSDTHHTLDERFFPHFEKADEIWHAGDIGDLSVTDKLKSFAPLRGVWGNIDNKVIRTEFKEILYFKSEEVNVMMTHIGGYPGRYEKKILPIIEQKKPDLFISGHSHILKIMYDKKYELLHMNPGAIGDYGIHKVKTILSFKIEGKEIKDLKVIEFPRSKS
ncbi:MAG: metallophosphoesterase family protein [Bacteroidota bacterium]|nr:metallophosphoesterase family protein [Bacteroidota bacterium]